MWLDLAQAFCLMLVLEGIMPFLAPGRWRNMRIMGLVSMLLGAGALYFITQ